MLFSSINAQEKLDSLQQKENPIVFADASFGYTNGYLKGISVAASFNYQKNNNLYTFRASATYDYRDVDFISFIPNSGTNRTIEEYGLLYGKRYVEDGFSYHFSGGFSYNVYVEIDREHIFYDVTKVRNSYFGFPVEIGFSWFKPKKEKFRVLYGLIPVGNPTSFGRSFGVKLYASLAEKTYIGIGLSLGFGWHKKY